MRKYSIYLIWALAFAFLLGQQAAKPALMVAKPIVVVDTSSDSEKRDELVVLLAGRYGVDTSLALDVSHAENWTGNPKAVSPAGAIGLMQVMPFWKGEYPDCGEDLTDRFTNVCYGVRILRQYLDDCGKNTYCATNKYNGAHKVMDIVSYQSELGRARGRRSGS